jgi:zinc transport system permease protein
MAGIGIAIITSLIGVFVLWKKMAYFSDAISHSAIFGLGIATIIAVEPMYGIILCAIIFCFLIFFLDQQKLYSSDTIIGISSSVLISFGMILVAIFPSEIDIEEYLFGELIFINGNNIFLIYFIALIVVLAIFCWFKKLLLATINPDLARISGIETRNLELKFSLLTAFAVAGLIKIVGIFLLTSMMILPATIARNFARTPLQMLVISILVAIFIMTIGSFCALFFSLPSSPTIIAFGSLILAISITIRKFR